MQITHPGKDLPELLAASIHAIANVLSYDGLSGINKPLESVDSLTSMVRETDISQPWAVRGPSNFLWSLISNDSQHYSQKHGVGFQHQVHHQSFSAPQNRPQNQGNGSNGPKGETLKRHRGNRR